MHITGATSGRKPLGLLVYASSIRITTVGVLHACKKANVFDDDAQKIMNVLHEITYRKRCRGSGARTPPWLKRLVDAVADDDDEFEADTDAKSVVSKNNNEESFGPKDTAVVPFQTSMQLGHKSRDEEDRPLRLTRSLIRHVTEETSHSRATTTPYSEKNLKEVTVLATRQKIQRALVDRMSAVLLVLLS